MPLFRFLLTLLLCAPLANAQSLQQRCGDWAV